MHPPPLQAPQGASLSVPLWTHDKAANKGFMQCCATDKKAFRGLLFPEEGIRGVWGSIVRALDEQISVVQVIFGCFREHFRELGLDANLSEESDQSAVLVPFLNVDCDEVFVESLPK
jgi:hypothetical protein